MSDFCNSSSHTLSRRGFVAASAVAGCGLAGSALLSADARADETQTEAEAENTSEPVVVIDCDIVVVGAGTAGMAAATQASEKGTDVVVLEKTGAIGGQSQLAEVMFGNDSRLQREQGLVYTDYELLTDECDFHNWRVDRELWSNLVEVSGESIDWLLDNIEPYDAGFASVSGGQGSPYVAHRFNKYTAADDGKDYELGGGMLHALRQILDERGVAIHTDCEATGLIVDESGDAVVGLYAQGPDGLMQVNAKAVILACGGFTGSEEMIDELGHQFDRMQSLGYATNVGDGIRMAREVGADHRGAMNVQLMGPTLPITGFNSYLYANDAVTSVGYPIWVNQNGARFMPEVGLIWTVLANSVDMQDDVYGIIDQSLIDLYADYETTEDLESDFPIGTKLDKVQDELEELIAEGADFVFKADTVEELADMIGVPADALAATIERYNGFCDAGADDDFGKDPTYLKGLTTAPYYACKVYTTLLCTGGGVRIDKNSRVLRPGSVPVPGLYCAGCDCDGFMGETYGVNIPGSTQAIALNTGRLAALHASEYVQG